MFTGSVLVVRVRTGMISRIRISIQICRIFALESEIYITSKYMSALSLAYLSPEPLKSAASAPFENIRQYLEFPLLLWFFHVFTSDGFDLLQLFRVRNI